MVSKLRNGRADMRPSGIRMSTVVAWEARHASPALCMLGAVRVSRGRHRMHRVGGRGERHACAPWRRLRVRLNDSDVLLLRCARVVRL